MSRVRTNEPRNEVEGMIISFIIVLLFQLTSAESAQPLLGLHILPSPIIPRARWAKGAKSPLAPTVPCSGTKGTHEAAKKIAFYLEYSMYKTVKLYIQHIPMIILLINTQGRNAQLSFEIISIDKITLTVENIDHSAKSFSWDATMKKKWIQWLIIIIIIIIRLRTTYQHNDNSVVLRVLS